MRVVDARRALVRNALAFEASQRPQLRAVRRRAVMGDLYKPQPASPEACERYDELFTERVHVRVFNGQMEDCGSKMHTPGCCARHDVLLELGSVEVWDYLNELSSGAVEYEVAGVAA